MTVVVHYLFLIFPTTSGLVWQNTTLLSSRFIEMNRFTTNDSPSNDSFDSSNCFPKDPSMTFEQGPISCSMDMTDS